MWGRELPPLTQPATAPAPHQGRGPYPYPGLVTIAPPEAPALPGLLYAQAQEYQTRLAALEDGAAADLTRYWAQAQEATQRDLDRLLARVAQATANGERLSPSWAFREARYRELLATATEQGNLFGRTAATLTERTQAQAAALGATSASSLGSAAMASAQVAGTFTAVNPDTVRHLAGHLADGTPLADLLGSLGTDALPRLRQVLGDGILLGRGVDRIRRDVLAAVDVPRWRAETIVRTESHRVFREASRETYTRNADVLTGWAWLAALDSRTCPGCVAMHGTTHPVTATLDGHPRCRCAMVPLPEGADLAPRPGVEWLADQPERTQRAVLGPGKFAAYKRGDLDLRALAARSEDPRWGTMRREATLGEALDTSRRLKRNPGTRTARDADTPQPRAQRAPEVDTTGMNPVQARNARDWARWEQGRDVEVRRPGQVPYDPDNPLAVYGDRLNVADRSTTSRFHLQDLEQFSPDAHRVLADHFATSRDGGFYVGDSAVPGLDDLGHLAGVRPRGWGEGESWDNVPGAYDPSRRVCACGGGGKGHGSTSLALHEGSHALDDALGSPSADPVWRGAVEQFGDALALSPYYRVAGNPSGYASETFAEAHAALTAARAANATPDDTAQAIVRALGGDMRSPNALPFGRYVTQVLDTLVQTRARG